MFEYFSPLNCKRNLLIILILVILSCFLFKIMYLVKLIFVCECQKQIQTCSNEESWTTWAFLYHLHEYNWKPWLWLLWFLFEICFSALLTLLFTEWTLVRIHWIWFLLPLWTWEKINLHSLRTLLVMNHSHLKPHWPWRVSGGIVLSFSPLTTSTLE